MGLAIFLNFNSMLMGSSVTRTNIIVTTGFLAFWLMFIVMARKNKKLLVYSSVISGITLAVSLITLAINIYDWNMPEMIPFVVIFLTPLYGVGVIGGKGFILTAIAIAVISTIWLITSIALYNRMAGYATGRRIASGIPLAFGEGDTKGRIKNALGLKKPAFWVMVITLLAVIAYCVGLIATPKTTTTFNGSSYRVEEILYEAPMYSFTYTLDTAPQYSVSADYMLYSKESADEDWVIQDGLYPYNISIKELHTLFDPHYYNSSDKIDRIKLVYRADTKDENQTFYLVMQLKNGDVLLALGYDFPDYSHIRWLFKLETTSEIRTKEIWQARTPNIGDNSAAGSIIGELIFPENFNSDGFELYTSTPPYGVTVKLKTDTRNYRTCDLRRKPFQINACIMFSLIENVEYINFSLDDGVSVTCNLI